MKSLINLLLGLLLLLSFINANGQTDQGRFLIGGESSLILGSSKTKWETNDNSGDYGTTNVVGLSPTVGIFVVKGLAIGFDLPITYISGKDDNSTQNNTSLLFAPFIRYYIGRSMIKPFVNTQLGIGIEKSKYKTENFPEQESSYNLFRYRFGGGIGIFFHDNVALNCGLEFRSDISKRTDDDNNRKTTTNLFLGSISIIVLLN